MKNDKMIARFIMSACLLSLTVTASSIPTFADYTNDQQAEIILWSQYIQDYANDAFGYLNRGNINYSAGEYAKAVADYDAALGVDKYNVEAYVKRGNAKFMLNDLQGALKDYAVALEINPTLPDAKFNSGRVYYKAQNYKQAVEFMQEGLKLAPSRVDYNFELAQAEYKAGMYDLAYSDFNQVIALKSDYTDAYYGKGLSAINLSKYEEAIESFDNAVILGGQYPNVDYYKGIALYQLGKYNQAIAYFDKAVAENPNDGLIYNLRGKAKELIGEKRDAQKDYKKAKALGVSAVGMGNGETVKKEIKTAKAKEQKVITKTEDKVEKKVETVEEPVKEIQEVKEVKQAEEVKPVQKEVVAVKGQVLSNKMPEITEDPTGIIEVVPFKNNEVQILDTEITKKLAAEQIAKGDIYTAVALYDEIVESEPNIGDNYVERAKLKLKLDDSIGAVNDTDLAIRTGNATPESFLVQGKAYEAKGNYAAAYRSYALAYKANPENPDTVIALAEAAYKVGRYADCVELYTSLFGNDAITFPQAYLTRAKAFYQMADFYSSIADINRYLATDKKCAEAYFIRAMDKLSLNKKEEAIEDFSKAIKYDSKNILYRKYRAQTNLALGHKRKALHDYRKIVSIKGKNATMNDELIVAQLEEQVGFTAQAIVNYSLMIQKDYLNADLYLARARVYRKRDEKINAINDYITTLRLNPNKKEVYAERGILYVDIKSYRKGAEDLTQAIQYDPNNGLLYKYRAIAEQAMNRTEEAQRDFEMAKHFEAL